MLQIIRRNIERTPKGFYRLQYISDIHLEYRNTIPKIQVAGQNLALLGDIGNPFKKNYKEFIREKSLFHDNVFVLSGNHEYWQYDDVRIYFVDQVDEKINEICNSFPNVHFLNKKTFDLGDYRLLGCTLWSKRLSQRESLGDDTQVYLSRKNNDLNRLHDNHVTWLRDEIQKDDKKKIVLTHFLPSYRMLDKKYDTPFYKKYQDRFYSHLDWMISKPIDYWLCGHTHTQSFHYINGVHCCVNSYGYEKQQKKNSINDFVRYVYVD